MVEDYLIVFKGRIEAYITYEWKLITRKYNI